MGHYLPQQSDIYIKNEFLPEPTRPSLGIHYIKIKIKTLILSVLSFVALIAIGVMTQQPIQIQTTAAEAITCGRCSNTNLGKWATFKTNDACPNGESDTAQPIPGTPITYEDKASCQQVTSATCTFDEFKPVPDWSKGNDSLGNGDYCGPVAGQTKAAACGDKDTGWVPGPKLEAGAYLGVSGHSPSWNTPLGGKLPVAYDSKNDLTKHEFNGRIGETNWSRFIRRMDDSYFMIYSSQVAQKQIATGVIIKYEIMRVARESVHYLTQSTASTNEDGNKLIQDYKDGKLTVNRDITDANGQNLKGKTITPQLLSSVTGFDVTSLDLTQWSAANNQERTTKMIAETSSCTNIPAPQPTAAAPVSCEEHLMIPPADFKTDLPSFTKNTGCSLVGDTIRNELTVCGDFWESAFCSATDQAHRDNAMFACRGWSQISTATNDDGTAKFTEDRLPLYFSNRLRTLSGDTLQSNIAKYGDARGRKITWNSLMTEVKQKSIAFPYEFSNGNKSPEEVRDNALQAAATAIFGKSWGAVKEQERLNNCSTTWDGTATASVATSVTNSLSATPTLTPNPTPTVTPTAQPTPRVTTTPTTRVTTTATPTPTTMPKVASVAFVNESAMKVISTPTPTTPANKSTEIKVAEDTVIDGAIGKDKNGNYFAPAAVVANDTLYVFVIGDGGTNSSKPRSDWYNAFSTSSSDGVSWNTYTNLSGTFSSPIKTSKLTTGNTDYIYTLGQGTDTKTYFKSTNSLGDFATSWNTISSNSSQYTSATTQREVRFKDHVYSFTTDGGKLKVCVDKQICRP